MSALDELIGFAELDPDESTEYTKELGRRAAEELATLRAECNGFKSVVEETMEALEIHKMTYILEAVRKDYNDVLAGKYEGKGKWRMIMM
jgi:hypothetical protein